jgi:hypothetical protein
MVGFGRGFRFFRCEHVYARGKPVCGLNITVKKKARTLKAGLERVSGRLDATKPAGRLTTNNE